MSRCHHSRYLVLNGLIQERDNLALPQVLTLGEESHPSGGEEVGQSTLKVGQYLGLGGEVGSAHPQRPGVDPVGAGRLVEADEGVGVVPVTSRLVSLVHDDGLQVGRVEDQLLQEAETKGSSSDYQVVGGELCRLGHVGADSLLSPQLITGRGCAVIYGLGAGECKECTLHSQTSDVRED